MTTFALVSLALFSWMASSGTRPGSDPCAHLRQRGADGETEGPRKTNATQACERAFASEPDIGVAEDLSFLSRVGPLQTPEETPKQRRHLRKRETQRPLERPPPKAGCVLRGVKADGRGAASASHCCCVVADCTFEASSLPAPNRQFGAAVPRTFSVCSPKMPSMFSVTNCQKDIFLTQAGRIKQAAHAGGADGRWVALAGRWAQRFFLAAVLLLGIHMTRMKTPPNRVSAARGSNATVAILFTVTCHSFSPSPAVQRAPGWPHVAAEVSFAVCLSCALGRAAQALLACGLGPTRPKLRALPVTALLFWLTFRPSFPNKNSKDRPEHGLAESADGASLKSWAVLRQLELLATLYCMFVSLPCLLQSIVTKLNFLSVFLHLQLVTCLQNSRVPIKYVVVIRINRVT